MHFEAAMQGFAMLHKQYGPLLDGGLLMFARMLGFVVTGPIFNRKNIPFMIKIAGALYFTATLFWMVRPAVDAMPAGAGAGWNYLILLALNITVGSVLGFIADMILQSIYAGGNLMNNQVGLSSAMVLDPATGKQSMILEALFSYLGILLFIHLGGVQWMLMALKRSFELLPMMSMQMPIVKVIDIGYLTTVSGNILLVGVQLMAPVMIVTMAVDLMLGIVNRTAQQMPVFQLSFALKPAIGIGVLLLTLSTVLQSMMNFLNDYSNIF